MNERIEKLKANIDKLNDAGIRRTLFYDLAYESLKDTRDLPIQVRRAKAQAHILDNAPLAVLPHELIVGSMTGLCPVADDAPSYEDQREKAVAIIESYLSADQGAGSTGIGIPDASRKEIEVETPEKDRVKTFEAEFTSKKSRWALMSRVHHDANISYEDLQRLIEEMSDRFCDNDIEKYEVGRELERSFKFDYGEEVQAEINQLPWFAANHLGLNYKRIAGQGFDALTNSLQVLIEKTGADEKAHVISSDEADARREYLDCAKIVACAGNRFIARYARELRKEAVLAGTDCARRDELLEMAEICDNIEKQPAKTFREAVQFIWFLHIMMSLCWGSALSFGRFDQYIYDYYARDLAKGIITPDKAKELLCCLWLKVNEPKMRTVQSLTLGGVTPDGEDGFNELTGLCLEVTKELKLPYPNVGIRVNRKNRDQIYGIIADAIGAGGGQPMIMNDDIWIPNLKKLGYSDHYANDYFNMGCLEIMLPDKQPNWGVTEPIAFPMLYEKVFAGYRRGEIALDSFAAFKQAYLDVLSEAIMADKAEADDKAEQMRGRCYDPLASLMVDGCIENCCDMFRGGSELGTHWSFYAYGLGTAADTMAAVRKHVYEDGKISIAEMADLLDTNFDGNESVRLMLEHRSPHYGNDLDEVDALADDILSHFGDMTLSFNSADRRDKYVTSLFGYFFHIYHGEITGATANGRRRGEAFSDSMGPSQGKDEGGPTKLLNSVLKLGSSGLTGGYALNLKMNPELVKSSSGMDALTALIKSYITSGGPQLQIYFVDAETLKAAKSEPEKHRDLIVRVGGYCEYFVNLDNSLQDEIISRTLHGA